MNKVVIMGNLGRDPEVRYTQSGTCVCNFSVAVTERYNDQEHTEWFNCVAWKKTAELIGQHFKKGKPIICDGKMKTNEWQDQEGNTRKSQELQVFSFFFVPRDNTENGGDSGGNSGRADF